MHYITTAEFLPSDPIFALVMMLFYCCYVLRARVLCQIANSAESDVTDGDRRQVRDVRPAPLITRLVAASVNIALKSGDIIRDILRAGDLGIVEKTGANDLQTQADRC